MNLQASDATSDAGSQPSFWDRVRGYLMQPPPPPAPIPPTTPPADKIPGTPEDLIRVQDEIRSDDSYKPNKDGDNKTYCNIATGDTVKRMYGLLNDLVDKNGNYVLANTAANRLRMSKDWKEVSPTDAQNLANKGAVVIGVQPNPYGHGHMVTVRPEGKNAGLAEMRGEGPLVNNIGRERNVVPADQAFDASYPLPRYYAPNKQ